jgi:HK97 family phage prohead protease
MREKRDGGYTVIVRSKGGEFQVQSRAGLLEFLRGEVGLRENEGGIRTVADGLGVECIAAVPFCLAADKADQGPMETDQGVPWVFSTFDLDRFDERVDPAGWDVKRYLENPVIQWAHCFSIPAIGRAGGVFADDKGLHGNIVFNSKDYDPFGWGIGQRVKAGVIRAGSVGFRILEIELPSKEDSKDGTALIFRKQELLEFSICNVPANPFALTKAVMESKQAAGLSSFWGNIIKE